MTELFGLPMSTLMLIFLGALVVALAWSTFLAARQPVLFRLAARNIPRRWGRSLLIVMGLTLATTIIAAALATGDTIAHSARSAVLTELGNVDQVVSARERTNVELTGETATGEYFDAAAFDAIRQAAIGLDNVAGVAPAILDAVAAQNQVAGRTEPRVSVLALDPAYMEGFGTIRSVDGAAIDLAALGTNEVLVNEEAADGLNAAAGDAIVLFTAAEQRSVRVHAVIRYDGIGTTEAGLMMTLAEAQSLFDRQGLIQHVFVSNRGDAIGGARHTDEVIGGLQPVVSGLGLAIEASKRDGLEQADEAGAAFATFFVTFGSFSIAAGILLIFLLFVMLSGERKPEMGIARAVGTERVHLVQMFMFEGLLYALAAAAVGALMGIGVAYVMVAGLGAVLGDFGIDIRFSVSGRSLITAYAMGVVLTFIVVTLSAWRVSVLNIVTAIRNLPEPMSMKRGRASLVWGAIALALGGLLTWAGVSAEQGTPFYLGVSLVIFGFLPLLRWAGVSDRIAFTVTGALVVVWWLLPWSVLDPILPRMAMDFNVWIVGGLITVMGVTWLVMYNSDLILGAVLSTLGRARALAPILKTALTYPLTNRFRTGVTLAMFTLVVFTLVVGGTATTAFTRAFNDTELFGGGFDIRARSVPINPVTDLEAAVAQAGNVDAAAIEVAAPQSLAGVLARQAGTEREFGLHPLRGVDSRFFDTTSYGFAAIATGYDSADQVWQALRDDPGLAVVDGLVAPRRNEFGFGAAQPDFRLEGFFLEDGVFDPITIEVVDPAGGETHQLTVIAVLMDVIPEHMIGITTSQSFVEQAFPAQATPTAHLFRLREGADAEAVANSLEAAFLANGMEATVLADDLESLVSVNRTFNYLIQGFIGLGLIVGVAALGVVSARAVVERRQEIGVMRAIGFEPGRVQLSFLIESSMVAVGGIVVGTALGLIMAYNVISESRQEASWTNLEFAVPWLNLIIIYAVVMGAALLTSFLPARQASRVYPAEALRYE